MPLDFANLDAPEAGDAQSADTSGAAAPGGTGSPDAGTADTAAVGADPAGDTGGGNDGGEPAGGEPEPAVKKSATVPHAALHEARETNKQLKARIAELEAIPRLSAEDATLLRELREQRAQPKKDEEQGPDFLNDPKGYVDTGLKQAIKKVEDATKEAKEAKEQLNQHQTIQAVIDTARGQVSEFVEKTPDYPKAIEHVRNMRRGQLEMLYKQATPEQIATLVAREEIALAGQVVTGGNNFAEFAYEYAKRMGYQPPKPPDPTPAKKVDASAVRTLGSGGTDTDHEPESTDPNDEFRAIQKEAREEVRARFRRRA